MSSSEEDNEEFSDKSLDELEIQRRRIMEQIEKLTPADVSESGSPSPKRHCLSSQQHCTDLADDRAAAGRDLALPESPISALRQKAVEVDGCSSPKYEEGERSSLEKSVESMETEGINANEEEDSEDDSDFDVDKLLEQPFAGSDHQDSNGQQAAVLNGRKTKLPFYREKLVLRHRSTEYFEVLPDGWIEVTHKSGLPVYLHKISRVCTFARPYFIGPGSVRSHEVPVAAIPCLHQQKVKEVQEREKQVEEQSPSTNPLARLGAPQVQVETAKDFKNRNLNPTQLHEYAKRMFDFETAKIWKYKSWSENRSFQKKRKETLQNLGRPALPSNVKLITVPSMDLGSQPQRKQFFLNPQGKTSIAVLHEYIQKVLKGTVRYQFMDTRNATQPYGVTVKVQPGSKHRDKIRANLAAVAGSPNSSTNNVSDCEEVALGSGYGNSKKAAKLEATKRALQVLVPGLDFNEDGLIGSGESQEDVIALFDLISVTDSRVGELSAKSGQPAPYIILQECLKRHSAFGNTQPKTDITRKGHQQHLFRMVVGKHEVEVTCTNKKEGKQKASQAMLEKLHPQVKTWGSLLRLYGKEAQRKLQEARKEKDSIIKLQGQNRGATSVEPNHAILEKLRVEMRRQFHSAIQAPTTHTAKVLGSIDI